MQELNPNLTDLLLLDDEQYKDKFNCDYTKQVRHSLWPEGYVQEIRSYYFSHLLDFKSKDRGVRICDYAKEILLDAGCYNIRVHNMIYILLATITAINTDLRGHHYMVKPCRNGMQIMSLRDALINDEAKSKWYNHNKVFVHSTDIKPILLSPLQNAPAAKLLVNCVKDHFFNMDLTELISIVKRDGMWIDSSEPLMEPLDPFRDNYRRILKLDND